MRKWAGPGVARVAARRSAGGDRLLHRPGPVAVARWPRTSRDIGWKAQTRQEEKNIGSTLDSLFDELGEREDIELLTQKKLLAAKIERAMAKRNLSQAELARTMRTSRTVIHRLLDPRDTSVRLAMLSKASKALGVKLLKVA